MTEPKRVSAARKALTYAETELGVNSVYLEVLSVRNKLDSTLTELSTARDKKRDLDERLQDREMEIRAEERARHTEMSAAAMDKHVKVALHNDDSVREYREQIQSTVSDIEGLEFDKSMHDTDIKIAVARLQELGGYLNYLAAIKQAALIKPPEKQEKSA